MLGQGSMEYELYMENPHYLVQQNDQTKDFNSILNEMWIEQGPWATVYLLSELERISQTAMGWRAGDIVAIRV